MRVGLTEKSPNENMESTKYFENIQENQEYTGNVKNPIVVQVCLDSDAPEIENVKNSIVVQVCLDSDAPEIENIC